MEATDASTAEGAGSGRSTTRRASARHVATAVIGAAGADAGSGIAETSGGLTGRAAFTT